LKKDASENGQQKTSPRGARDRLSFGVPRGFMSLRRGLWGPRTVAGIG
jgi:hypothetical protein